MLEHHTKGHFLHTATAAAQAATEATSTCKPFSLPQEYGYVIVGVASVVFTLFAIGMILVSKYRSKVFNKEFMKQFESIHSKEHDSDVTKSNGYPDMGSGIYAQKLPYKDWRQFNCAQRAHHQFLENAIPLVVLILFSGLYYPSWAIGLSIATVISRIFYCFYVSDGGAWNPLRLIGALGTDFVILIGLVLSVLSGLKMACAIDQ